MKITFRSLTEKVLVLRKKSNLKNNEQFKTVYVKSSKSRAERLMEQNTRALLRELPAGHDLRIDASGRLRQRNQHQATARDDK